MILRSVGVHRDSSRLVVSISARSSSADMAAGRRNGFWRGPNWLKGFRLKRSTRVTIRVFVSWRARTSRIMHLEYSGV